MKRADRLEALKPHLQKASQDWIDALDAACIDPNPMTLQRLRAADSLCNELERLRQDADALGDKP